MGGGGEKIKFYFVGEGREEKKGKKKYHYLCFFSYINVFLSLSYLQYLQVLIQDKALWCRLQATESSAGSGTFPGLAEHKKDLGIGFAMATMPGQTRGRAPALSARTRLCWGGRAGLAQGMNQWLRCLWVLALGTTGWEDNQS